MYNFENFTKDELADILERLANSIYNVEDGINFGIYKEGNQFFECKNGTDDNCSKCYFCDCVWTGCDSSSGILDWLVQKTKEPSKVESKCQEHLNQATSLIKNGLNDIDDVILLENIIERIKETINKEKEEKFFNKAQEIVNLMQELKEDFPHSECIIVCEDDYEADILNNTPLSINNFYYI